MYYFIGIKGTGMSALAVILKQLGYEIMGSDVEKHFFTESELVKNHIPFYVYDDGNIHEGMTIIKGASIKESNPELIRARSLGLEILEYHEMVGKLSREFKTICVAGCHGKTTTTNMMALAFQGHGINYLIGDGTGSASKDNSYFALESCEYKRHFLAYQPYYAVITNIDLDHVDYYKNIEDVIDAYTDYANHATKEIIAWGDDPCTRKMKVTKPIKFLLDALAVISVCIEEGISYEDVNEHLKGFVGAKRRFSEKVVKDSVIIDDYAHHPNEVKATVAAIRQKYPDKQLVIVFQPHTFSRTREFAHDLVEVFKLADYSYVLPIHPAREKQEDYPDITSEIIVKDLKNGEVIGISDANKILKDKPCVYAFMSPNDISELENSLEELLKI